MYTFSPVSMLHMSFFFFSPHTPRHAGSYFPTRDRTCAPLQWESRVLTTTPPGKYTNENLMFEFRCTINIKYTPDSEDLNTEMIYLISCFLY